MSPKSKRILKRIAIGVGLIVVVLLLADATAAWWMQHRLNTMVSQLRAEGEPTSLADLAPKPIPTDDNAAVFIDGLSHELELFDQRSLEFEKTDLGKSWDDSDAEGRFPSQEQLAGLRKLLDESPAIIPAFKQAAECNKYASLADFTQTPKDFSEAVQGRADRIRSLANYVCTAMIVLAVEQKRDDAIRLGTQLLRLAKSYSKEPCLSDYLVSNAVQQMALYTLARVLEHGPISAEANTSLDLALEESNANDALLSALKKERALDIAIVQSECGGAKALVRWFMLSPILKEMGIENQVYDEIKRQPDLRPPRLSVDLDQYLPQTNWVGVIEATLNSQKWHLAYSRCLRLLNAVAEYRRQYGKDPDSVDQVSVSREALVDPFSGKRLILKKAENGWIVYSVGLNGVDDGADFEHMKDIGFGPPGYKHQ